VEKCPETFMTLVKAYTNKKDFAFYKTFCKEGVTDTMVSSKPPRKLRVHGLRWFGGPPSYLSAVCFREYQQSSV